LVVALAADRYFTTTKLFLWLYLCSQAVEDGVRLSKDSLRELFTALSPPGTVTSPQIPFSSTPDNVDEDRDYRRSVRDWMEKKKVERMKEFRQKLDDLRDAEKHPFKPRHKTITQVLFTPVVFVLWFYMLHPEKD